MDEDTGQRDGRMALKAVLSRRAWEAAASSTMTREERATAEEQPWLGLREETDSLTHLLGTICHVIILAILRHPKERAGGLGTSLGEGKEE